MKFDWDKSKQKVNIHRHGIDFQDAVEMFIRPLRITIDKRYDYGEERWVGIGFLKDMIAVVVYTENDDNDSIRLISVRKATNDEVKKFKKTVGY